MLDRLLETNLVPDFAVRAGIRRLLRMRLQQEKEPTADLQAGRLDRFVCDMKKAPIALNTREANEQHYEVPARFFELVLGDHLKYSCAYWENGTKDLSDAEAAMLQTTCERAQLENGQTVLELGCGWGSLSLFMANRFPESRVVAISNSNTQRETILAKAHALGVRNLQVITCDMNEFEIDRKFDRIVSIEMFEHMRNYQRLLEKCSRFLADHGKLFIHIFVHREFAYCFEPRDESDWMARYFFTGGLMPSDDLLSHFHDHFHIEEQWRVNGIHYSKTADAWLHRMDQNRDEILDLFSHTYGPESARKWWAYWRIFFLSCSELWGFRNGEEWFVSHYRLVKDEARPRPGQGESSSGRPGLRPGEV